MVKSIRIGDDNIYKRIIKLQGAVQAVLEEKTSAEQAIDIAIDCFNKIYKKKI